MSQIVSVKRQGKTKDAVIESKDQRWHCRNRVTLVFGSNDIEDLYSHVYRDHAVEFTTVKFHQAKSKAIEEILDNAIDEYYRGHVTQIHTSLSEDGQTVSIEDNGIGFPLNMIKAVYTEFRTGSKFKDEELDKEGFLYRTLGQNGLGAAATCLTSDFFKVRVRHYNSKKEQTFTFEDGVLKTKKTKIKTFKGHSGVRIELRLAKEVYKDIKIDEEILRRRIIDLAYNNPGLIFYFNGEKYFFKKGLFELAQYIDSENAYHVGDDQYKYETQTSKGKKARGKIDISFSLTINKHSEERERFISFANSSPTFDGGFHQDRIRRIFINSLKDKLERSVKKEKISITDNDILTGITFIIGVILPNARFESQTKRKLVRDQHLEKAIENFMNSNIDKFIRKHKEYLEVVMERARSRHRFQAFKDAAKKSKKQKKIRIEKLLDANERRDRSKCTLFICEGDSAIGGLRSARNKLYQGGIALKGKPMNVAQASINDVLNNQEFTNIMGAIGLTLGQEVDFSQLRFSKIVFLSDSDVDGGHINTLLTNFFYTFWPELFENEIIQIAKAPLFEIITDKEKIYAESPGELENIKNKKIKIKEVQRNKGLGEMSPEAFKYVMRKDNYTKVIIEDKSSAKGMLEVCFGKDSNPRKKLLLDEADQDKIQNKIQDKTNTKLKGTKASKKKTKKKAKVTKKKSKVVKKSKKKITKKKIAKKK